MRLIFLGPPGAGKGTQAQWLGGQFGLEHLSSGDMFREAVAAGTPMGKKVEPYLRRGELVPDGVTVALVMERLEKADCAAGYVLDGFPRTRGQAEALDRRLAEEDKRLDAVLLLVVEDEELVRRLTGRRVCSNPQCNGVFHLDHHPPQQADRCDRCGQPLEQREDDRPETVRNRLKVYHTQTAELVDYYRQQGLLEPIDGTGSVDQVQQRLTEVLERIGG